MTNTIRREIGYMDEVLFAALFILYNPLKNELEKIKKAINLFDKVYIYDNSPVTCKTWFPEDKVKYFGTGCNDGLSIAYNYILRKAKTDGIKWITIFDQDSEISSDMLRRIKGYIYSHDTDLIAAVVPAIQYGESLPKNTSEHFVSWAINSGETINIDCIAKNDITFDENLFLDRVDRDFSKQVELKGLKMVQVKDAVLKHQLGEKYNGHTIHSPMRNYYIFKNRLYYNDKYYGTLKSGFLSFVQSSRQIMEIILSRKDVIDNLNMIREAKIDYINGKMGKKNDEN